MSDSTPTTPPSPARAERRCPACGISAIDNVTASGFCRGCGHDLIPNAQPPLWKRDVDLRAVARHHRHVQVLAIALLMIYGFAIALPAGLSTGSGTGARGGSSVIGAFGVIGSVVPIVASFAAVVLVSKLTMAMRWNGILVLIFAILAIAPCLNIVVLLIVAARATGMLKTAGLEVGLMGVSDEQVLRVLSQNRCRTCGYILVLGSASTHCPECGALIERGR